ncbi:MAG: hydantoinase/oxoprolinase family protein [Pseudomonadota bacterium]
MRIGVDVGGTHTDAALLDGETLRASTKQLTSDDIASGVLAAVRTVLDAAGVAPAQISMIVLGTTQMTNAVVERQRLEAVGALRIGAQSSRALPVAAQWPADLRAHCVADSVMVDGGHEYDGSARIATDEGTLAEAVDAFLGRGVEAFAVTGVFATANPAAELAAAAVIRARAPQARIALSHQLGRIGLYQRENATLLNASLLRHAERVFSAFEAAFAELKLRCPLFISQNDGTVMTARFARQFPVLTFSSGPTNSMRGAAFLSGVADAMVVDVGGTTSDIGMLQQGFPRPSGSAVSVGGVLTNFRMPDVLALGIGGGSLVADDGSVGPLSVGRELPSRALCFGGEQRTATDVAVATGRISLGDRIPILAEGLSDRVATEIRRRFEHTIDKLKTEARELPLIVVGGGGFLVPDVLDGVSEVLRPEHADVANAIGAAFAQVSGEAEVAFAHRVRSRDEARAEAQAQAEARAIEAGAVPDSLKLVDVDETPMAYLAEPGSILATKVIGDVDVDRLGVHRDAR